MLRICSLSSSARPSASVLFTGDAEHVPDALVLQAAHDQIGDPHERFASRLFGSDVSAGRRSSSVVGLIDRIAIVRVCARRRPAPADYAEQNRQRAHHLLDRSRYRVGRGIHRRTAAGWGRRARGRSELPGLASQPAVRVRCTCELARASRNRVRPSARAWWSQEACSRLAAQWSPGRGFPSVRGSHGDRRVRGGLRDARCAGS